MLSLNPVDLWFYVLTGKKEWVKWWKKNDSYPVNHRKKTNQLRRGHRQFTVKSDVTLVCVFILCWDLHLNAPKFLKVCGSGTLGGGGGGWRAARPRQFVLIIRFAFQSQQQRQLAQLGKQSSIILRVLGLIPGFLGCMLKCPCTRH